MAKLDRATELRSIYDTLRGQLADAEGSAGAAIARELRILAAELEVLEKPAEVTKVDELTARRAEADVGRPPSRRRKSG
jgi:hypothetical protein